VPHLQLTLDIGSRNPDLFEDALFGLGAVTTLAGMFVVLKILKRRGSFTHV